MEPFRVYGAFYRITYSPESDFLIKFQVPAFKWQYCLSHIGSPLWLAWWDRIEKCNDRRAFNVTMYIPSFAKICQMF